MSGSGSANAVGAQQKAFNEQLYNQGGQGAGLDNDYKMQLSDAASKIGKYGRKQNSQNIQGFHELIWNNPNIPNELKQVLANYALYPGQKPVEVMPSGGGQDLANTMGGAVNRRGQRIKTGDGAYPERAVDRSKLPKEGPNTGGGPPSGGIKASPVVDTEPAPAKPRKKNKVKEEPDSSRPRPGSKAAREAKRNG